MTFTLMTMRGIAMSTDQVNQAKHRLGREVVNLLSASTDPTLAGAWVIIQVTNSLSTPPVLLRTAPGCEPQFGLNEPEPEALQVFHSYQEAQTCVDRTLQWYSAKFRPVILKEYLAGVLAVKHQVLKSL